MNRICLKCNKELEAYQQKYCLNRCQVDYQYDLHISKWKSDSDNGKKCTKTKNISRHIKLYLIEVGGEKCSSCGWKRRHTITGKVPLEVDHKDGDASNNNLNNLRLLCPNCHALTPSFRNLNKGKGRSWRMRKG